jgi:hypothetical protein
MGVMAPMGALSAMTRAEAKEWLNRDLRSLVRMVSGVIAL